MPLDYKYTEHEGRRNWLPAVSVLLLIAVISVAVVYGLYFFKTRKTTELILTGNYEEASARLTSWKWLPLTSGIVYEKLGTAKLLAEGSEAAVPFFRTADQKLFLKPVSIWQEVLKMLWGNGKYVDGLTYAEHIQKKLPQERIIHFYKSGYYAGTNQLALASKELAAASELPEYSIEIAALKSEIDQRKNTQQYTLFFDRENLPLVNVSLKGEPRILYEPVRPVLINPGGNYISKIQQTAGAQASLTIDYRIQNAALKALEKYAGSIVLLDVRSGEILAAASNLKGIGSEYPAGTSLALNTQYEPGSIIKMITLAGSLEKQTDLSTIFPLECKGSLNLADGKILYDWKVHGQVKDFDTATAVSCNVSFARLGLAMKPADLLANLKQFGFDSKLEDAFLPLELGKIVSGDINESYLSNLSIGLEYLQITPLHAAMIASAIANKGVAMTPQILRNYRNIIGLPYGTPAGTPYRKFMSEKTSELLTRAMVQVVQYEEGTGRRAAIEKFPFAMKTGTAGIGAEGYNAILIGFGPVPNPKIAFAVVLEHCGKAEFEGARVTRLFLESIQGYI